MKIGIITFHWAANYGAVLQCYALQETLKGLGHDVFVINYKPAIYDNTLWSFVRRKKFLNISKYKTDVKKESLISKFRALYLNQTKRFKTLKELKELKDFDMLISGSDQVLNSTFLIGGESGGSTAYYLDFGDDNCKRVTYAASFGTTDYPVSCIEKVRDLVGSFTRISVRENTGVEIFEKMGRDDAIVVPDPTFLLDGNSYKKLFGETTTKFNTTVYLLHGREKFIAGLNKINYYNNNGGSIETWLQVISSSSNVITNSFHGTVFCIHFHVPFVVVLETMENKGMNDRFFSMLSKLGLESRITTESDFDEKLLLKPIDWNEVDRNLEKYRNEGLAFLESLFV